MGEVLISTLEKKRRLPFSLCGDSFNMVFAYLTFFGPIFPLFLDSLDLDKKQIGLLMSLMPFSALIAPLIVTWVARFGFKRSHLTFWVLRNLAASLLIGVPWVFAQYGPQVTYFYVMVSVGLFALCRAIAETAFYPWSQEFIPPTLRGKFAAVGQIVTLTIGAITVALASHFLGDDPSPQQFAVLMSVAVVMGLIAVFFYAALPGGAPIRGQHIRGTTRHAMRLAIRDRRFLLYLGAFSLVLFGGTAAVPFVPLFMKEQVGLTAGSVIQLESVSLLAGLISCFLWGWAADRYGGKPIMVVGLILFTLYPIGLLCIPRNSDLSLPLAYLLAGYVGIINPGWAIGSTRVLFVEVVPEQHKTGYLSLYYAWLGFVGGAGPLISGRFLAWTSDLNSQWWFIHIDAYTPIFSLYLLVMIVGVVLFSRMESDGTMSARRFAGMFLRGNPVAAMNSLVVHNMARHENDRIVSIERLGDARRPLNVAELIAALDDPSYNVRVEAIVSMARTRPAPELADALMGVVRGPEADIAITAVWALGRMGDRRAIGVLRERLLGGYPLLAAHSARAIAQLGAREVIPLLEARLHDELDPGLRLAYASALGTLRHAPSLPQILDILRNSDNVIARRELSIAIGCILRDEAYLIRLWRRLEPDRATTLSEAVLSLRRWIIRRVGTPRDTAILVDLVIQLLADGELDQGAAQLVELVRALPVDEFHKSVQLVLKKAASQLQEHGSERVEYILLVLFALDVQLKRRLTDQGRSHS